jgi:hypothetical protein
VDIAEKKEKMNRSNYWEFGSTKGMNRTLSGKRSISTPKSTSKTDHKSRTLPLRGITRGVESTVELPAASSTRGSTQKDDVTSRLMRV